MTLEQLSQIHPLTVKECQTVEDINYRLALKRSRSKSDTIFFRQLAAHRGGIFDEEYHKFKCYFEYNPLDKSFTPARIRITSYITEKNIIKRKGCVYVSGWNRELAYSQLKSI